MEINWVWEMDSSGFEFQSYSLLAVCIYLISLCLNSLFRKIIPSCRVGWRNKYFTEGVQDSVEGVVFIMIMMTNSKAVTLCLPANSDRIITYLFSMSCQHFLQFLPSFLHSVTPHTLYYLCLFSYLPKITMTLNKVNRKYLFRNIYLYLVDWLVVLK